MRIKSLIVPFVQNFVFNSLKPKQVGNTTKSMVFAALAEDVNIAVESVVSGGKHQHSTQCA